MICLCEAGPTSGMTPRFSDCTAGLLTSFDGADVATVILPSLRSGHVSRMENEIISFRYPVVELVTMFSGSEKGGFFL